jgi:hypothetical protein
MREIAEVLATSKGRKTEQLAARKAFIARRAELWQRIQDGHFPSTYVSADGTKFVGAPRRTAIRCEFLLANKIVLGSKYRTDRIADLAQRDLLFHVLRYREVFPNRTGNKFYCCPRCTAKLYQCVSCKVFRYIDNAKWQSAIDGGRQGTPPRSRPASRYGGKA